MINSILFKSSDFIEDGIFYSQPFKIVNDIIYVEASLLEEGYVYIQISYTMGVWVDVPLSAFLCSNVHRQGYKECNISALYRLKSDKQFIYAKVII